MRLKKLELFGFKSFADKTQVIFDEGVTCIVGPNGCGKSNISDAIRWVLGERSAKLLRGSKMEDVIFNGTEFRKPLAIAEVALTIDNTDRGLPIDYPEVTLARRLYRSGESEYLINKTACRLKDIQDLILDTGMGSSTYSMIEQGKIDYILNAEPEERRSLIEEAAGIAKYKVKKEEAIRKLERTEENRLRLNDIVHEVQKNIQYAERQARRAQRYQEHLEKLKNLEIRKAYYDLSSLDREENQLGEAEQKCQSENSALDTQLNSLRSEQANLNQILTGILDRYSSQENKRHQIESRMTQNGQRLHFHQEKRMEMASRQGQIQQENLQLEERVTKSSLEIDLKKKEIRTHYERKAALEQAMVQSEQEMQSLNEKISGAKAHLDHIKSEAFQFAAETSRYRNEYHRMVAFLESGEHHKKRQETTARRLDEELAQWHAKNSSYDENLSQIEQNLSALHHERSQIDQTLENLQRQIAEMHRQHTELQKKLHEKEASLKLLTELHQQYDLNENSLFGDSDAQTKPVTQTLKEIFTVSEGCEWALEAALDSFSKSLVAENEDMAHWILQKAKEKKRPGLGIFIPQAASQETKENPKPKHPLVRCALREVVQTKPGFEPTFASFFDQVYLLTEVPNAEAFKELIAESLNFKFLAPDGTVIGPSRRIYLRKGDLSYEYSYFQRESEIKQSLEKVTQLRDEIVACKQAQNTVEQEISNLESKLQQIDSSILDAKIYKESTDSHQKGVVDRIASLQRELQLIAFESEELSAQYQKAFEQKEKLEAALRTSEAEEKKIRESQEGLTQDLEAVEGEKANTLRHLTEVKSTFDHLQEQAELIGHSLKLLEEHRKQDQTRMEDLALELKTLKQKEAELQGEDEVIRKEQETLDQNRRQSEVALEFIRREKEAAENDLAKSRQMVESIQSQSQELQAQLHQFAMKKLDLGYQKKNISERLLQTYKLRLSDYSPELYPFEAPTEEILGEIQQLREKVESIGTVNLLAIEEYEELKQRYEFLQNQMKDLEQARDFLMETIRQINRTTKNLFRDTFATVQQNFQEYYQTLFGGGIAKLVLLDETNPLESGIDIVVRPPGKKLQNIRLLSGGEKALTAIALLFALFKIKPSPFSLLDEVDAPLDEANVDRFLAVLKTFLATSQFIIVTHNRKTIAMGDTLYGVTMEEAGISKMVSVRVGKEVSSQPTAAAAPEQDQEPAAEPISN